MYGLPETKSVKIYLKLYLFLRAIRTEDIDLDTFFLEEQHHHIRVRVITCLKKPHLINLGSKPSICDVVTICVLDKTKDPRILHMLANQLGVARLEFGF
jgi:hypothetical protein